MAQMELVGWCRWSKVSLGSSVGGHMFPAWPPPVLAFPHAGALPVHARRKITWGLIVCAVLLIRARTASRVTETRNRCPVRITECHQGFQLKNAMRSFSARCCYYTDNLNLQCRADPTLRGAFFHNQPLRNDDAQMSVTTPKPFLSSFTARLYDLSM